MKKKFGVLVFVVALLIVAGLGTIRSGEKVAVDIGPDPLSTTTTQA